MEFVIGIIGGICLVQFGLLAYLARDNKQKKDALNAELKESIANIALAHNNLVASIAEVDKKAQETKVKLSMMHAVSKPATTKFG